MLEDDPRKLGWVYAINEHKPHYKSLIPHGRWDGLRKALLTEEKWSESSFQW